MLYGLYLISPFILLILLAVFTAVILLLLIKALHLLQLNGYSNSQTLKWLQDNHWLRGLMRLPTRTAKKPLVWTARIVRLFILNLLFVFVIAAIFLFWFSTLDHLGLEVGPVLGAILYFSPLTIFILVGLLVLYPFVFTLTNVLISPLERAIKNHYIRDAKRILSTHSNLIIIGITGSYGKTSMKHYLHTLVGGKYSVLMTPESYNTPMGVVRTIREQLQATHEVFICEMGARHKGDIAEICDIVRPHIGVITAVAEQHLETFKSLDAIIQTKFELAQAVAKSAGHMGSDPKSVATPKLGSDPTAPKLICSGDDVNIGGYTQSSEFAALNLPLVTYGLNSNNNYSAQSIKISANAPAGSSFSIEVQDHTAAANSKTLQVKDIHTCLIGQHNVQNITGAVAVAIELGVDAEQVRQRVGKITATPHRLEITNAGAYTLLDDAFNSNPAGAAAALDVLSQLKGYKILITPGMIELGAKEEEENAAFGRSAARVCDLVYLVNTKQSDFIKQGLIEADYPAEQIVHATSFNEAFALAIKIEQANKIILIENDLTDIY